MTDAAQQPSVVTPANDPSPVELAPSPVELVQLLRTNSGNGKIVLRGASDCPPACESTHPKGTLIHLSAGASSGSTFTGWLGPCSGTQDCEFVLDRTTVVTAIFSTAVGVTLSGGGAGRVVSEPAGIDCGSICSMPAVAIPSDGSLVSGFINLHAIPEPGSRFVGWVGACVSTGGRGDCGVFSGPVRAVFERAARSLPRRYRIVSLERPGMRSYEGLSRVLAIDGQGTPVGRFDQPIEPWNTLAVATVNGTFTDVTPPGRDEVVWGSLRHTGELTGIDAFGNVFGTYGVRTHMAFRRAPDGTVTELGPDLAGISSWLSASNAAGDAVGWLEISDASRRKVFSATRFSTAGPERLPGLAEGSSYARALDARGNVVGCATSQGGILHPVLWGEGRVIDLDASAAKDTCAVGIDDGGEVLAVRQSSPSSSETLLIRGGSVELQALPGLSGARMNAAGQIIASGLLEGRQLLSGYLLDNGQLYDVDEMLERQDCAVRAVTAIGDGGHLGAQVSCPDDTLRMRPIWSGNAAVLVPIAP